MPEKIITPSLPGIDIEADDYLLFQGYNESRAYRVRNEYQIYYNDNNRIVDKPLYIFDGDDPNDKRKIENDQEEKSIKPLMSYKNNGNNVDLVKELNSKGYDIIIVNHPVYNRGSKEIDRWQRLYRT